MEHSAEKRDETEKRTVKRELMDTKKNSISIR